MQGDIRCRFCKFRPWYGLPRCPVRVRRLFSEILKVPPYRLSPSCFCSNRTVFRRLAAVLLLLTGTLLSGCGGGDEPAADAGGGAGAAAADSGGASG
ncbi:MAG TPA: hypothetical protein DIT89_01365, partial [Planctomycetaceae bacterium]|nr:hypothetical protein [Planctomycetaceae bacterium]